MYKFIFKIEEYGNDCVDIIFDENGSRVLINAGIPPRLGFVNSYKDKIRYTKFCKRLNIHFPEGLIYD